MSDLFRLQIRFRARLGYSLNLKNPKTFNEKIQWLKLYGNLQRYTHLADKYEVRKHIASTIGEEYLIPLLGVWDQVENIDFSSLPEQFVLKCSHDAGSIIICADKAAFDVKKAKKKLKKHLKRNFYDVSGEPQYKDIKPRIICEKYMVEESGRELRDCKVFCFHGIPRMIIVNSDRFTNFKRFWYDVEWNCLSAPKHATGTIARPSRLEEMMELCKVLSKGTTHVRIDFCLVRDTIYFGELTFTHGAGFAKLEPEEFDSKLGTWFELPGQEK